MATFAVIPYLMLRRNKLETEARSLYAPLAYARKNPGLLTKLLLPMFVVSIGAGLIMPFMNIFFSNVHNQPDPVIGTMFAWGAMAMGIGVDLSAGFCGPLREDPGGGLQPAVLAALPGAVGILPRV
jgi:hypothetical protein